MADEEMSDILSAVDTDEKDEDGVSSTDQGDDDDDDAEADFDMEARIGHFTRAEMADLPAEEQLQKWKETLFPTEVDLVTELDASNLFFIHAESIIFDMISSREVVFQEDMQFLRLTHAIEQLLTRLRSSGGVFRLVFFDASKALFSAAFPDAVWTFRQAFLLHCRTSGIDHVVFPHWYSDEWKKHIREWRPSFVLLSSDTVELEEEEDEEERDEEEEEKKVKLRGFFHALMLRCLSYRTHVGFLHGLQHRGNRIMAFTLDPETYDAFIDSNVQASLLALFSSEEEEDEAETSGDDFLKQLKAFGKEAGDKVTGGALLRSFLMVRFVKSTMAAMKGQNEVTVTLMKLVTKTLMLQEMMLRHIPMDKRAYSTCATADWEMFDENITAALERYFGACSEDLACVLQVYQLPEDAQIDTSDLFDGRLYRHMFHSLVSIGLEAKKGQVDNKSLALKDWVEKDLEFLWSKAMTGSKDKFFPVEIGPLKSFEGISPPDLPAKSAPRSKPKLRQIKVGESDLLDMLDEAAGGTKNVEVTDVDSEREDEIIWKKHKWVPTVMLDAVKDAEHMEKSAAEKKWDAKKKEKNGGKTTQRDIDYERKFQEKKRQLALRALSSYARSLTGSDKLHPPIIMKATEKEGDKKDDKKDDKVSGKHRELLEKRAKEEEEKMKEHDKDKMKTWDKELDSLAEIQDMAKLETSLLDLLLGFGRITDSFVGFPAVCGTFKTTEAMCKVVIKAIKNLRTALKKIQLDRLTEDDKKVAARRLIRYLICMVQECFNSFGKKDLDGKGIKLLQEALLSIRFQKTSTSLFKKWYGWQMDKAEAELKAQEDTTKKGDAKDKDKKKGKDDKKDDKKGDAKDKDKKKGKDDKDKEKGDAQDFEVKKGTELLWSGVGDDEFAFQLQEMGQYMQRTVGNAKDEKGRVNFKPDKWQRDLLDIVDNKESALIVAPTASGKTFIGYYVMDKVLRTDNDGVAVYVAPSKALVNQVSAEIYARFSSKSYPMHSKHELLGVFLKEFNSAGGVAEAGKWKNCQVLVTIPHILELLLMSPSNQEWVKRLRYVVFDEVHCIGGEDGLQWEHTMQLIPCPFLALSATVAQPQHFHGWLERINKKKEQADVKIVVHTERFNDLYKFIYREGRLQPLHPFCCLKELAIKADGLRGDFTLTPQEMGKLHGCLSKIIGKQESWDRLAPAKYFADHPGFLSKHDAREYEKSLKQAFTELLQSGSLNSAGFSKLQLALQSDGIEDSAALDATESGDDGDAADAKNDFVKMGKGTGYLNPATLYKLCKDLEKIDALPAIVFNFSRKEIDRMLTKLTQELKDRQMDKYYGTEEAAYKSKRIMEKRQQEYTAKVQEYEQKVKMKAGKNQQAKASRKTADDGDRGAVKDEAIDVDEDVGDPPEEPVELTEAIDLEFSFHSPKAFGQWHAEINEMIQDLRVRKIPKNLIEGLQRGIGIHHEGCRTKYRDAVEILFRRGYLKVVFATGTLALGINMPCRTTIFCGESLELNGLMFRQMSGRAGRRGFDLLGQVVFLDMAFLKISSLVASDLPVLAGEFNTSPTTLLRSLHQMELVNLQDTQGKELPRSKEDLLRTMSPLFSMPFFRSEVADLDTQVAYQTRFSVDYLYQEGLLSSDGSTRGLANLATMLFEIEPANIILARLLGKGLLHDFLIKESKKHKKGDRRTHITVKLVGLLSWLLYRRRLPETLPHNLVSRKKHLPSKECPKLPPLPPAILAEVITYNKSAFEHVQQLAWSVASTKKIREDDLVLPFSKQAFRLGWDPRGEPFDTDSSVLAEKLVKQIVRYRARSPFSAISGTGDYFSSPSDLVNFARSVLHLDLNSFPALAMPMNSTEEDRLEDSNSWMVDFMIHGKIKYLWEDNGIGPTKAWKLISEFGEAVKKATTAIRVFCPKDDIVLTTFEALAEEIFKIRDGEGGKT